jgi:hypothetical protein
MDSRKVIDIVLGEASKAEERYPGYRDDLKEVVAEIVSLERQHKFMTRNIKSDIAAQISRLGADLVAKTAEEGAS